jgi:hypothetical protein
MTVCSLMSKGSASAVTDSGLLRAKRLRTARRVGSLSAANTRSRCASRYYTLW